MSEQLALDLPPAPETGVVHTCLPDFTLACGLTFLEKPEGDRVTFGWHATKPTCVWCRSLGRDYANAMCRQMQAPTTSKHTTKENA